MIKVAVLGSSTLKKSIDLLDQKMVSTVLYSPKISLATLLSPLPQISPDAFNSQHVDSFTHKLLLRDLSKSFFSEMKALSPDILLIDCSDDIFDLIKSPANGALLTKSNYLSRLSFEKLGITDWSLIKRNSDDAWRCWNYGCKTLFDQLHPHTKIILVKIYQPVTYYEDGQTVRYSEKRLSTIEDHNIIIGKCYESFINKAWVEVIDIPLEGIVSNTAESVGYNPTNLPEKTLRGIAQLIASSIDLPSAVVPTMEERMDTLFGIFGSVLKQGEIPSISELHAMGNRYLESEKKEQARWSEKLITLLRNSSVPLSAKIGKVQFGYGGIGVIVHAACEIGDYVNIGSNVTLGGGRASTNADGREQQVPYIEDRVYIATGAKILGGVTIGHHSIIGANSVVITDIPPFSVVAGNPAKIIRTISKENISKYSSYLYKSLPLSDVKKIMFP